MRRDREITISPNYAHLSDLQGVVKDSEFFNRLEVLFNLQKTNKHTQWKVLLYEMHNIILSIAAEQPHILRLLLASTTVPNIHKET